MFTHSVADNITLDCFNLLVLQDTDQPTEHHTNEPQESQETKEPPSYDEIKQAM